MPNGTWTGNTSANWNTTVTAPWASGQVASGVGFTATFSPSTSSSVLTATLTQNITIGGLDFAAGVITIARTLSNVLTLDTGTVTRPTINTTSTAGNSYMTISAPLVGTNGFNKTGGQGLVLSGTASTLSGVVTMAAGTTEINGTTLQYAELQPSTNVAPIIWTTAPTFGMMTGSGQFVINNIYTGSVIVGSSVSNLSGTMSGVIGGVFNLYKEGSGTWTIANNANTYTGSTRLQGGKLVISGAVPSGANSPLGNSTSAVELSGSNVDQTLEFNYATNLNFDRGISYFDTAPRAGTLSSVGAGAVTITGNVTGSTTNTLTLSATSGASVINTISGVISGGGATPLSINKTGTGVWALTNIANTYSGTTTITAGTLSVSSAVPSAASSPLGNASSAISLIGTLRYAGASAGTIGRIININGASATLEATGAGAVTISSVTRATGNLTLTGTSTAGNRITGNLPAAAYTVTKTGVGTWYLQGTIGNTGGITVSDGTLGYDGAGSTLTYSAGTLTVAGGTLIDTIVANVTMTSGSIGAGGTISGTSSLTMSGGTMAGTVSCNNTFALSGGTVSVSGTVTGATPVVATGGTISGTISGTVTLTVNSGTTTVTSSGNSYTGATAINSSGILKVTPSVNPATVTNKPLGDSNVTVNNNGTIQTYWAQASQASGGRMRYGGNLTLNTGSTLAIGGAA